MRVAAVSILKTHEATVVQISSGPGRPNLYLHVPARRHQRTSPTPHDKRFERATTFPTANFRHVF